MEYKNEHAAPQYASHPSYRALSGLGTRADIPVLASRYADDFSSFTAVPLNGEAKMYLPDRTIMTELEWVKFLYLLRGHNCPQSVIERIKWLR